MRAIQAELLVNHDHFSKFISFKLALHQNKHKQPYHADMIFKIFFSLQAKFKQRSEMGAITKLDVCLYSFQKVLTNYISEAYISFIILQFESYSKFSY